MGIKVFTPLFCKMNFNINEFRQIHGSHIPELSKISDASIEFWAKAANLILKLDSPTCLLKDEEEKKIALQMFVCHVGAISARGLVGTMTNASEGSVSVGTQLPPSLSRSWVCGTPCGLLFWQLWAKFQKGMRWYPYKR